MDVSGVKRSLSLSPVQDDGQKPGPSGQEGATPGAVPPSNPETLKAAQISNAKRARHAMERRFQSEASSASASAVETAFRHLQSTSPESCRRLDIEIKNGFSHVAWGSKPASLIWMEAFHALESLEEKGLQRKNDFLLLKAPPDEEDNLGYGGMLINKHNLAKLMENDPDLFKDCEFFRGVSGFDAVVQHLQKHQCSAELLEDEYALGILLGYGKQNSYNYALLRADAEDVDPVELENIKAARDNSVTVALMNEIYKKLPNDPEPLQLVADILRRSPEEAALQNVCEFLRNYPDTSSPVSRFPAFTPWDGPESRRLCIQALKDSIAIEMGPLKNAKETGPSLPFCKTIFVAA